MAKITLVNLNSVKVPAIAPIGIEYLANSLYQAGQEFEILDLTPSEDPINSINNYFSSSRPDLVGLSLRNSFDIYFPSFFDLESEGSFLKSHKSLVDAIKKYVPSSRIIVGGAGFSTNQEKILQRLGLSYGVIGPGEQKIVEIANRFDKNGRISDLKSEIFDGRNDPIIDKHIRRDFVDALWYYRNGGMGGITTSNGCARSCDFCVEPYIKGPRLSLRNPENIAKELTHLVNLGVKDIHSADSEFNASLPYSKEVLKAIIQSEKVGDLPNDYKLWLYCTPTPFDKEYADLLVQANVAGINISPEHFDPEVLSNMRKWYIKEEIIQTTMMLKERGIKVMIELLHGHIGDNPDKMYRAIDTSLELDPEVTGVSLGIGVLPRTGLAKTLAKSNFSQQGIYCSGELLLDPTFYVEPSFKVPEIFEELNQRYSTEVFRMMLPRIQSTHEINNQLVGSDRVKEQLIQGKMGPSWAHYREMMRNYNKN